MVSPADLQRREKLVDRSSAECVVPCADASTSVVSITDVVALPPCLRSGIWVSVNTDDQVGDDWPLRGMITEVERRDPDIKFCLLYIEEGHGHSDRPEIE